MDDRIPVNLSKEGDPNYRYWMNKLKTKETNNETEILNLQEISDILNYPEEILLKFFSSEVGTSNISPNKLKGSFPEEKLQILLYRFIDEFKICSKCDTPELTPYIEANKLKNRCSSCGITLEISKDNYKKSYNSIKNYLNSNIWPKSNGFLVENNEDDDDDF